MDKSERRNYIVITILCAGLALLILGPTMLLQKGFFTIHADYNLQQIPFTVASHKQLINHGFDSWMWNMDLGASFIQSMGFYTIGTPFFWITMLFPAEWAPYVMFWLFIIKFICAGLFSYLYFKRFVKDSKWAVIGAILYAFSGYQLVNIVFYHFMDVVAFFPLMLVSLEKMMNEDENKSKLLFSLAVFLNCVTNYLFFVQEAIFLIIYFLFRFWDKDIKKLVERIIRCIIFGALGVGMSAFVFLPGIFYIMGSSRNSSTIFLENILLSSRDLLRLIKGIVFPADVMWNSSAIKPTDYASTSAYLPLFGAMFAVLYIKNNKDWLKRLLLVLFVIIISPLCSSVFLGFTEANQRWWFMLEIVMILATLSILDNQDKYTDLMKTGIVYSLSLVFFAGILFAVKLSQEGETLVYSPKKFLVYFAIALMGSILVLFLYHRKKMNYRVLLIAVVAFAFVSSEFTFLLDKKEEAATREELREQFEIGKQLTSIDDQYRYISSDNNITIPGETGGLSAFCTTTTNSVSKFDAYFDYSSPNTRMNKSTVEGLRELLGGKYYLSKEEKEGAVASYTYEGTITYVYEAEACPIGYAAKKYFIDSELQKVPKEKRGKALLAAVAIDAADIDYVAGILDETDICELSDSVEIDEMVNQNIDNRVQEFTRTDKGFVCKTDYESEECVYFTVPYEKGWKAYIDGEVTGLIESGAMMLIKVPAGKHGIEFVHETEGFKIGIFISCVSLFAVSFYAVIFWCLRGRKKNGINRDENYNS